MVIEQSFSWLKKALYWYLWGVIDPDLMFSTSSKDSGFRMKIYSEWAQRWKWESNLFFFFICLSNLFAKVMSPCDRSHSHFTYQLVDYDSEVIRKRDGSETARYIFFLTVWKKRPQRSFWVKSVYPQNSLTHPLVGEYLKFEEMKSKHPIYSTAFNLDFFKGNSQLCLKLLGTAEKDIYITVVLNLHMSTQIILAVLRQL